MLSESEWLRGLMGLKKSKGTVSCWDNVSGCECTEPLEPEHIEAQQSAAAPMSHSGAVSL